MVHVRSTHAAERRRSLRYKYVVITVQSPNNEYDKSSGVEGPQVINHYATAAQTDDVEAEDMLPLSQVEPLLERCVLQTAQRLTKDHEALMERVVGRLEKHIDNLRSQLLASREAAAAAAAALEVAASEKREMMDTLHRTREQGCTFHSSSNCPGRESKHVLDAIREEPGETGEDVCWELGNSEYEEVAAGDMCVLRGLVSKPELNGKPVLVLRLDTGTGRLAVRLRNGKELLVKRQNLEGMDDAHDALSENGDWG